MKKKITNRSRRREPIRREGQKPEIGEAVTGIVKEEFNKSKRCK